MNTRTWHIGPATFKRLGGGGLYQSGRHYIYRAGPSRWEIYHKNHYQGYRRSLTAAMVAVANAS